MTHRRTLIDGLNSPAHSEEERLEKAFVFGEDAVPEPVEKEKPMPPVNPPRSPLSTRIRADFATALKRASLERQLDGQEPSTLQGILEQAIEPWLKEQGYLD